MTISEFNALPEEARRFIQDNAGCLSCGSKERKLTAAYELYKKQRFMKAYSVKGGGVNYVIGEDRGVLYNIKDSDDADTVRHKLTVAKAINEVRPHTFYEFNEQRVDELLSSLGEAPVVDITPVKAEEPVKAKNKKAQTPKKEVNEIDDL